MIFTLTEAARSLADYLAPHFPQTAFYEDPSQQGGAFPCMFLQQRSGGAQGRLNGYRQRRVKLDLVYLEDYNLPDLHRRYLSAAERLEGLMDKIPYSSGGETALLHTYEREWDMDADALHYRFQLRLRDVAASGGTPMMKMDMKERIKDGERNGEKPDCP